jgi:hypothetical protein
MDIIRTILLLCVMFSTSAKIELVASDAKNVHWNLYPTIISKHVFITRIFALDP